MNDTLETVHRANRLAVTCAFAIRPLRELAGAVNELNANATDAILNLIQDAITAAEAAGSPPHIDAPTETLRSAYFSMRRPPEPPIATVSSNPAMASAAQGLDQITAFHQSAVDGVMGDSDPGQQPTHVRNALWQALACQDAMRKAAAAARQASHSSLVIAGV